MYEDFGEYNLDRLNARDIKSQDVIKKHSLDPHLDDDPIQKANLLLVSGDELQKYSVLISLPDLFRTNPTECVKILVPKMQQYLPGASLDYHMLASSAVCTLMQDHIITPEMFIANFLNTILTAMDSKDVTISTTWSETLSSVIEHLPVKSVQNDIFAVVIGRLDGSLPMPVRVINCKILTQLIRQCDHSVLKRDLVTLVVTLCQDVSSDIRAAGCGPLASLAIARGADVLKSHLMNALVDIASDDAVNVRQAAFPTLINICPVMPIEILKNTGIPLLVKFIKLSFKNNEFITSTISEHYGKMCLAIDRGLSVAEKEDFFTWYQSLTSIGSSTCQFARKGLNINFDHRVSLDKMAEIREFGASNFMLMTKFTKGDVDKRYTMVLIDCFHCLISDPSPAIRRSAAAIFSEALTFFNRTGAFMKQELNLLLTDSADDVLEALVPQLSQILDDFVKLGVYKAAKDLYALELVSSLMKCENTLSTSHRWRSYVCLLSQMEILCKSFNTEAISVNFLPLLWKRLTSIRSLPNRTAVFRFIIIILRMSKREQTRSEIVNRLINELCLSNSFYSRMLFIKCCPFLNEVFSTKFIKQHFMQNILLMSGDRVANIRWLFVAYLPNIKGMLSVEDRSLTMQLQEIIEKFTLDQDAEVRRYLARIKPQLDSVDRDKMYPDDRKKYDNETSYFSGKKEGSSVNLTQNTKSTLGTSTVRPTAADIQAPRTRQFNNRTTSSPVTSRTTPGDKASDVLSQSRKSSVSCVTDLNEKEFLIDAGVKLPVTLKKSAARLNKVAACSNGTIPIRRSIPGSRIGLKRHSTPATALSSLIDNKTVVKNNNKNDNNNNISNKDVHNANNNNCNKIHNSNSSKSININIKCKDNNSNSNKSSITGNSAKDSLNRTIVANSDKDKTKHASNKYCNTGIKGNTSGDKECSSGDDGICSASIIDNTVNSNESNGTSSGNKNDGTIDSRSIKNNNYIYKTNDKNKETNQFTGNEESDNNSTNDANYHRKVIDCDSTVTDIDNNESNKNGDSTNCSAGDRNENRSDGNKCNGVVRRVNASHLPRPLSLYNLPSNQLRQQINLPVKHSASSLASRLPVYRMADKTVKR